MLLQSFTSNTLIFLAKGVLRWPVAID